MSLQRVADADLLFSQHRRGVFRYLCRVVGQTETAHDLTQEVFLRVSRTAAPDAGDDVRRAWLFRIARNLALNHIRDSKRRPETTALVDVTRPATQEVSVAVGQALAALSDLDRDVFLLRESGGLSYEEVAAACEITTDAVRSRLHRARMELRQRLAPALAAQRTLGVRVGHKE